VLILIAVFVALLVCCFHTNRVCCWAELKLAHPVLLESEATGVALQPELLPTSSVEAAAAAGVDDDDANVVVADQDGVVLGLDVDQTEPQRIQNPGNQSSNV
jgi:hypothetical protein